MSNIISAIENFKLYFELLEPPFNGQQVSIPIEQRLIFSDMTNVAIKEGTYTPNNDYDWIWQSIAAGEAPNFILLQTPTSVNLSITTPNGSLLVNATPINKIFMLCLPPGTIINNIYLEGRIAEGGATPMAQGVPASYFCLMAQANF
jgi:hypothetical protein